MERVTTRHSTRRLGQIDSSRQSDPGTRDGSALQTTSSRHRGETTLGDPAHPRKPSAGGSGGEIGEDAFGCADPIRYRFVAGTRELGLGPAVGDHDCGFQTIGSTQPASMGASARWMRMEPAEYSLSSTRHDPPLTAMSTSVAWVQEGATISLGPCLTTWTTGPASSSPHTAVRVPASPPLVPLPRSGIAPRK